MEEQKFAIAKGDDIDISTKQAIEICRWIKGKKTEVAKKHLENVIAMKEAVPYKRFFEGAGHKPGVGPGQYPKKAAKAILKLVKLAEANANNLGLSMPLYISKAIANKASSPRHYGRRPGRRMKRTHIMLEVMTFIEKPKIEKAKEAKEKKKKEEKSEMKND